MIYLIGGSSHVGKTLAAQKLMERTGIPYTSLDHLKMGFIRSGMTDVTVNVEAVFREKVGIETADYSNINIFSTDNKIYVNGAEGMTIYIYDVNGRCMARRANAADSETFTVETTGVVLVKAGNAPAKRVVLVR